MSEKPLSWPEVAPALVEVAARRAPADMVIRDCRWVNVHSREVIPGTDIAIKSGRFAYCGPDAGPMTGPDTEVIEARGRYLIPGLCDGHMHIESGMLTVTQFARAVMPHGTTTMFVDPHEIANVMGLPGVRLMHDEALDQPVNVYVQMPSCAPSAPGLETTGVELGPADVVEAMGWPNIIGLGEMMNYPAVVAGNANMLGEIAATQAAGKTVGGHFASPDLTDFPAYVAAGPSDDHEGTRESDAIARVRQGMRAMLRLGSAWYDVAAQITAVTERGIDPRGFVLCTDDCHSGTLVNEGHMNRVVRHAIACGLDPLIALQMATINTATHFGLERELGSIAPGRRADCILTSDLISLPIETVVARGRIVAEGGVCLAPLPDFVWPPESRGTVNMARDLAAEDFDIKGAAGANRVRARVIGVVENQAPTKALEAELPVEGGVVEMDLDFDICQIALVERHRATGQVVNGFVSGFRYDIPCAIASTVAHDSHHMIVVGTSKQDMAHAANRLRELGGGITVWRDGAEIACVPLPIGGLMSDAPAVEVAVAADGMVAAMRDCGCDVNNAYMQHSLLALVVIPELRISDLGLIDVTRFEKPIFYEPLKEPALHNPGPLAELPVVTPELEGDHLFNDAAEAVADLERRYHVATHFLRRHFADVMSGTSPRGRYRAFYPQVSVTTGSFAKVDSRLSFGHVTEPGTYATTITRPDLFKGYLTQQIGLLIQNHGMPVRVGTSDTAIPLHFAMGEGAHVEGSIVDTLHRPLRDLFDVPDLNTTDDHIVNGNGPLTSESARPLAPFTAQRIDYSLARLAHYTATSPEHFQNHVLFTNYQFYMDEFVEFGRRMLADPDSGYESFIEPGNLVTDRESTPSAPPTKSPQMPAFHLTRPNQSGITMVNIGVGPSNAKTITDHVAVLRPHVWLMLGHCAGLRNSQSLGDYVLAHAYMREDHVLDDDLPIWVPIPALAEVQVALEDAVARVTGLEGYDLKKIMRTGTVATIDNRNWELRDQSGPVARLSQARAIALDMESATIAANGFRFRVPYGTLLCVSDKPLHGELKLPGMATAFYKRQVAQHLEIGIRAMEALRDMPLEKMHSRKLRSFDETAFL